MTKAGDASHLLALHKRLLEGDRLAPEELAGLLLNRLAREIARKFSHTDIQLVYDGVTDALLDYCAKPTGFNASLGVPLDRFLAQAAWRNVANLVRGERRRKIREEKSGEYSGDKIVELHPSVGNTMQNEERLQQQQLAKMMQLLESPVDKKVLELRIMGVRRTQEFAKVMGILHLPSEEQRLEVKRAKDRIEKLVKRRIGRQA